MTTKKTLFALAAAASLSLSGTASAAMPTGFSARPGIIAILIGLLLPAVQKVREAA